MLKQKLYRRRKAHFLRFAVLFACILLIGNSGAATAAPLEPMVKFSGLKETLAELLPDQETLTRRDIVLTQDHLKQLENFKNWDTQETEFILYHSRNAKDKITRSLILFPEKTRQGTLLVAVALDNSGKVTEARLMEAQEPALRWVMPLLRADYMKTFVGADSGMKLVLDKNLRRKDLSDISQTYALHLANAVKKSAQLFKIFFNRN